jgi:hypothetical protein
MINLMRIIACVLYLSFLIGCNDKTTQNTTSKQSSLPDMSQARPYTIDNSNIQLVQVGESELRFNKILFDANNKNISVAVTTPNAWELSHIQRAHTAMRAAYDVYRATRAESILMYLLLDAGLPKITFSVAAVAYAPNGRDWNDGHGVQVWDVQTSSDIFSQEQVAVIQSSRFDDGRSSGTPSIHLPISMQRFGPYYQEESASKPVLTPQQNLDKQLFVLVSPIVTSEKRGLADRQGADLALSLIEQGANVNARDDDETPLLMAARTGHLGVMRVLLDKGAGINAQSERGETALIRAASASDIEMVKLLLSRGANPNIETSDGLTALSDIEEMDDAKIRVIRGLLRKAGAK